MVEDIGAHQHAIAARHHARHDRVQGQGVLAVLLQRAGEAAAAQEFVVDAPGGVGGEVDGVGPGARGGDGAMVADGPFDVDRLPGAGAAGNGDGIHLKVGGRRRVDEHWHGFVAVVVALVGFEHLAGVVGPRRVGHDEHVIRIARQVAGNREAQRLCVASARREAAEMAQAADVTIGAEVEERVARQVNQIVPFRLQIGRGASGVGDRPGDIER